jgi:hypothetical protein
MKIMWTNRFQLCCHVMCHINYHIFKMSWHVQTPTSPTATLCHIDYSYIERRCSLSLWGEVFPSHGHATRKHRATTRISKGSPLTSTQSSNSNRAAAKALSTRVMYWEGCPGNSSIAPHHNKSASTRIIQWKSWSGHAWIARALRWGCFKAWNSLNGLTSQLPCIRMHVCMSVCIYIYMYIYIYACANMDKRACVWRQVCSQQRCIHVSVGG